MAHLMGDDEADEFVVKVFDPALMGLLEADAATQTFLDRAGLQKLIFDRGAQHWAPIYEMKAIPEGAYYVTDFYPLTAQKLLDAKFTVTSADLHWLVGSIVRGLLELRSARKRAHANLKPGNIMIASREGLNGAAIFLADPASSGKSADDRVSDMRAIGKLVHQLVLGQPWRGEQDWPISDGPQWSKLGREAKGWRELCRQLLDPNARPEDVEALGAAVDALVPRPPKRRHLLALAALPVVGLIGLMGVIAHSNYIASQELASVDHAWFARFAKAMEDPARRDRYRADPHLKLVVDELEQAEAKHLPLNAQPPGGLRLSGADESRDIFGAIKRIEKDLSSDQWNHLTEAITLKERCAQWHWDQPAEYLAKLLHETQPAEGADVAGGIDRFLRAWPRVSSEAETAEALWKPFDADLHSAEQTGDKTLSLFAGALRRSALVPLRMDDDGLHGLDELQADAPLAKKLAEVARDGWPDNYGRERLAKDVESRLNMVDPTPLDVKQWVQGVSGYRLVPLDASSQAVASLMQSFTKAKEDINRQGLLGDERARADRAEAELEARIKALTTARYLSRDVRSNSGDLAANCGAVRRDIDALRKEWVKLDDPGEWLAFVDQPLPATSDRLKERWKQWVDSQRLRSAALAQNHEAFVAAKKGADSVRAALAALDQKFPPVPLGLSEKFASVAWEKREQALGALSEWASPQGATTAPSTAPFDKLTTAPSGDAYAGALPLPPTDPGLDEPAASYAEWVGNLKELNRDFPLTRELLTLDDRPDQKWKLKNQGFWNDPAVQTLVRQDVSRLGNLQNVADATREQLVGMASGSSVAEIAYAAWWRLGLSPDDRVAGVPTVTPAWPTQKGELDAELAIRARLDTMLKGLKNSAEATGPLAQLDNQGPSRWRRYTQTCDPDLLPGSARLFRSFGVDEGQVNKLTPNAHFDFFLYLAKVAATGARDEQVTAAADNLRVSAANFKDRPEIADLIVRLEHVGDREPMNDPKLLEQKPGDAYKLSIKNSPYSLQFVRVAAPGVRPFYLATTETSIGIFMDTVSAANAWPGANGLLTPPGRVLGPQAWGRDTNPANPIVRYATWRFDDGRNPAQEFDFVQTLRQTKFNRHTLASDLGGNPQEEHPMQQVPAQAAMFTAALLNCRLPTVREWQSAYTLFEAKTDIHQWNLRDQTFKMQLDYRAQDAPNQWPDNKVSGAYWPKDRPRPGEPNVHDNNDGTLLFRKVDSPAGSTFLNLVGNVAELVCNAPEAFDGMPDRRTPDAVAQFAASMVKSPREASTPKAGDRGKLFVIGASALSDPALDPIKPYPVTSPNEPFADVGFRLAFTAPALSLSDRLKWAIDEQQYLPAVPPATTNASAR
jgi:hypothetical protein